jgi:hypothetical protein
LEGGRMTKLATTRPAKTRVLGGQPLGRRRAMAPATWAARGTTRMLAGLLG